MKHEKTAPNGVARPGRRPSPRPWRGPAATAARRCTWRPRRAPASRRRSGSCGRRGPSRRRRARRGPRPRRPSATFSFQRRPAASAPAARKPAESSKGPVGPRIAAAAAASCAGEDGDERVGPRRRSRRRRRARRARGSRAVVRPRVRLRRREEERRPGRSGRGAKRTQSTGDFVVARGAGVEGRVAERAQLAAARVRQPPDVGPEERRRAEAGEEVATSRSSSEASRRRRPWTSVTSRSRALEPVGRAQQPEDRREAPPALARGRVRLPRLAVGGRARGGLGDDAHDVARGPRTRR